MSQITFNSQEEFENAVMDVLANRLSVRLNTFEDFGDTMLELTLSDKVDRVGKDAQVIFEWDAVNIQSAY